MKDRLNRLGLNVIAVLVAAIFAGGVTSIILAVRGDSPSFVISQMWDFGTQAATEVTILNTATYYYLSAIAVAIGFRMNLFNIGVDGQYQLAPAWPPRSAGRSRCRTACASSRSSSWPCWSARRGRAWSRC